jgi:hypothetical protein
MRPVSRWSAIAENRGIISGRGVAVPGFRLAGRAPPFLVQLGHRARRLFV